MCYVVYGAAFEYLQVQQSLHKNKSRVRLPLVSESKYSFSPYAVMSPPPPLALRHPPHGALRLLRAGQEPVAVAAPVLAAPTVGKRNALYMANI